MHEKKIVNICGMICLYTDITKQKEAIFFRDADNAEGFPGGSDGKEPACNAEGLGSTPGLRRSPGEQNGKPLQYSCLEIPWTEESSGLQSMVLQSWTRLSHFDSLTQQP